MALFSHRPVERCRQEAVHLLALVATMSKRLGHTSTAVTLNTYSHWLPEQDREAADVMARLLAG
jgi:integrase